MVRKPWKYAKKAMPDLIFLDFEMPVMKGDKFLEQLRQTEAGKKPKVIICSGNSTDNLPQNMVNLANGILPKPVTANEVRKLLKDLVPSFWNI